MLDFWSQVSSSELAVLEVLMLETRNCSRDGKAANTHSYVQTICAGLSHSSRQQRRREVFEWMQLTLTSRLCRLVLAHHDDFYKTSRKHGQQHYKLK